LIKGIYVITDPDLYPGRGHLEITRAALAGGASIIQLRDKTASDEELLPVAVEMQRLCSEAGALFIVNDRVDVALQMGADGIHVGQSDGPAGDLRRLFAGRILGVSTGTEEEAKAAALAGADYVGVGPVYDTSTKKDAGPALCREEMQRIKSAAGGVPVVAIGGISEENLSEVATLGVESAAVISAVVLAPDMEEATRSLVQIWNASNPDAGEVGEDSAGTP
jgi:thiamine-phosphate pyrophosphorylase